MKTCIIVAAVFCAVICQAQRRPLVGSGRVVPVAVPELAEFSELELSGMNGDIQVTLGAAPGLRIVADDNLADRIEVRQQGQRLTIAIAENRDNRLWIEDTHIRVELSAPGLSRLDVAFNGRCQVRGIQNERLSVDKTQNGNLFLFGSVGMLTLALSGNGDVRADSLVADRAEVVSRGNGDARLFVREPFDAVRTGNGSVLNLALPAGRAAAAMPPPPAVEIILINKSGRWRRDLQVKGPEKAPFSYGFDLGPFGRRKEKWPVGSQILAADGRVLYEVRAQDAGSRIEL